PTLGGGSGRPGLDELGLVLHCGLDRLVEVEKPRCVGGGSWLRRDRGGRACACVRGQRLCTAKRRKERKEEDEEGALEHGPVMLQSGQICTFFLGSGHPSQARHPASGNVVVASISSSCVDGIPGMTRRVGRRRPARYYDGSLWRLGKSHVDRPAGASPALHGGGLVGA